MSAQVPGVGVTADGKYLDPPGGGSPFLAAPARVPGATATIDGDEVSLPGAAPSMLVSARPASRLAAAAAHRRGALLAALMEPAGPWDTSHADVVLAPAAADALAAGLRSGGRPLLLDARDPDVRADSLVAAFDVGAAGALVRTGDAEANRRLVQRVNELEAERLGEAPLISVVVCNHNGAPYLDRCLRALSELTYPRYEVILCDDGSTDDSVTIARSHGVRVLELDRVGLSRARNAGAEAARGEVVAYIDGDTEAEPHWLDRTWRLLDRLGADGTGGPNLPFPDAGFQERAIAGAPGSSTPVVKPDGTAILLAGCNMAFRREAMLSIGGFDESFRGAYDDVVFCLRMAERGKRLVFHPTAAILHHRRDSIPGFVRQQYAWGAGTERLESAREGATGPDEPVVARRGLELLRMDMSHVFTGPQARQLYLINSSPLHTGLPLKALVALGTLSAAAAGPAVATGRRRAWAAASGGALALLLAVVFARVPVFAPRPGPAALAQRIATGALWFAQPAARRCGDWRARRGRQERL